MSRADESRGSCPIARERVDSVQAKDPAPLATRQAPDIVAFDVLDDMTARAQA
jgi:hypothetical protein